jgi:hypothetical protein
MMRIVGMVLIALGVAALIYRGVTWTEREQVIDLGPLKATADRERTVPLPWYVGAGLVGVGALVLLVPRRR